ncbi:MAG: hypothetical protein AAF328_04820 [Planctomycetota bacterium]
MMFLSAVIILPLVLVGPYAVTLRAAWSKQPARLWRGGVMISLTFSVVLAALGSPLFEPAGLPLALPNRDPWSGTTTPGLTACVIVINALLAAGVGLLPLATASTIDSVKRWQTFQRSNRCP